MAKYAQLSPSQLTDLMGQLTADYKAAAESGLGLDLSRGNPSPAQLNLCMDMLDVINKDSALKSENGIDCRNYGGIEGIPEARRLMAGILDAESDEVMAGGSSSLNLMHDCISIAFLHGLPDSKVPWRKLDKVKFLCPSPGYDRHFKVTQHFGFELVTVPMTASGPDMDVVESLVRDDSVKGMWCVPKYSNPTGITFSDDTVRRMAALVPAAEDFCIFYDNAYAVHDLYPDHPDRLLPLLPLLKEAGRPNMAIQFASTAKVSFAGGGISALNASKEMLAYLLPHFNIQTICYDKVNQLRHARYFKDMDGIRAHMSLHADIVRPKFEAVLEVLENRLGDAGIAHWSKPRGGYFISLDVPEGCAKRVHVLCKEAGVTMTPPGATFPYGNDPADSNLRIAPTFPNIADMRAAAELLCLCVRLAAVEKLLKDK